MSWWVMLLLIIAGCFVLSALLLLPFGYAIGAAFGSVAKRAADQEPADHG